MVEDEKQSGEYDVGVSAGTDVAPPHPTDTHLLTDIDSLANNIATETLALLHRFQGEVLKMKDSLSTAVQAINERARTDHKTPLLNERALSEYRKKPGLGPLSVYAGDINKFKTINDDVGYETADQVIHSVGRKIKDFADELKDVVAFRRGGDEFVILAPSAAKIIRRQLHDLIDYATEVTDGKTGSQILVTLVFGHAELVEGISFLEVLERADAACKTAKWQFPKTRENVVDWTPDTKPVDSKRRQCKGCGAQYNITYPPGKSMPEQSPCWICQGEVSKEIVFGIS